MSSALQRVTTLEPDVADLLLLAMFPDPERVRAALGRYASDPNLQVWVWQVGEKPVCAAGVRVTGGAAEILHLGTRPDTRREGHALRLLLGLMEHLCLTRLEAETDDEAVGFYRKTGFNIEDTEGRGGNLRYRCTLLA